jgi:hypothetical protein
MRVSITYTYLPSFLSGLYPPSVSADRNIGPRCSCGDARFGKSILAVTRGSAGVVIRSVPTTCGADPYRICHLAWRPIATIRLAVFTWGMIGDAVGIGMSGAVAISAGIFTSPITLLFLPTRNGPAGDLALSRSVRKIPPPKASSPHKEQD